MKIGDKVRIVSMNQGNNKVLLEEEGLQIGDVCLIEEIYPDNMLVLRGYDHFCLYPEDFEVVPHRTFPTGSVRDNDDNKPLPSELDPYIRLRFGYHMKRGAMKYEKGNWRKGQPTEAALESLHRHLALYEMGDRTEDHLSAIIFNTQLIMMNEQKDGINFDYFWKLDK